MKEKIKIIQGDITDMEVDAIVNAANNDLIMGGGVAGAIRRRGGKTIQDECNKIGKIPLGEAAITSAGSLKAKYVVHAASMQLDGKTTEANLKSSIENSLKRCDEKNLNTIAFPAVGAGIAGFPMKRCAEVMINVVLAHLKKKTSIEKVYFVLFDKSAFDIFSETLNQNVNK